MRGLSSKMPSHAPGAVCLFLSHVLSPRGMDERRGGGEERQGGVRITVPVQNHSSTRNGGRKKRQVQESAERWQRRKRAGEVVAGIC